MHNDTDVALKTALRKIDGRAEKKKATGGKSSMSYSSSGWGAVKEG